VNSRTFFCAFLLFFPLFGWGQKNDSLKLFQYADSPHKLRIVGVAALETGGYVSSMYGLYTLWYRDFPQSSFHWFNDNAEWLQLDKAGHAVTAYAIGNFGIEMLDWAGVERRKARWYGSMLGFVYQSTIEAFDGVSAEWGASWGDIIANGSGTALLLGQEYLWNEQRIRMKASIHLTNYAQYRPETLGSTTAERIFKDYNGQTHWLSGNIHSFMHPDSKFPKWLNVAVGYGAKGMTGGFENPALNRAGEAIPQFDRTREFYLSLDIHLSKIKTKSSVLNFVFRNFDILKIPAPTLEIDEKGKVRGWLLYF